MARAPGTAALGFAGEEIVLGVAGQAGASRERIQDPVHVEQKQGQAGGHGLSIMP
jgi:hypothetical protein